MSSFPTVSIADAQLTIFAKGVLTALIIGLVILEVVTGRCLSLDKFAKRSEGPGVFWLAIALHLIGVVVICFNLWGTPKRDRAFKVSVPLPDIPASP